MNEAKMKEQLANELKCAPEQIIIIDEFHNLVMFICNNFTYACNVTPTGKIKKDSLTNNF